MRTLIRFSGFSGFADGRHDRMELVRIARKLSEVEPQVQKAKLSERGANPRQVPPSTFTFSLLKRKSKQKEKNILSADKLPTII